MERKFKQPVSMNVLNAHAIYLESELEKMGYIMSETWSSDYPIITVNKLQVIYAANGWLELAKESMPDEYVIDNYNPELFLAIADMSEGETFYPGEWVVALIDSGNAFTKGRLYKITGNNDTDEGYLNVDMDDKGSKKNGWHESNFRKATLEEITAHFSKTDEIKPGDWVFALKDLEGTGVVKKGKLYKVQDNVKSQGLQIADDWVTEPGQKGGWSSVDNFRKATTEETAAHLAKKEEVKPEWKPEFGEEVEGLLENGRSVLGTYIEPSSMFSRHYVKDKDYKDAFYQCVSVRPYHFRVSQSELINMYAKEKGVSPKQIVIV